MTFMKRDVEQDNLVDGSIYVTDVRLDGIYVTIAGNHPGDIPSIVAFDAEDVDALRDAISTFDQVRTS